MSSKSDLLIEIDQGKLQGRESIDLEGKRLRLFQGIPYAKPPIGERRFKAPEPPEPWGEEVYDATKERDACYAKHMLFSHFIGSEDCLYLNVYTPEISNKDEKLPVMFWIHGGGYLFGSSHTDVYGPEYLVSKRVVLVTINYRLGFLGFLALNDPKVGVTGNAGLKDQVEALRWVKKNISQFGGDPQNVTVFGQSAGAACVNLLQFSPLASGLFHKAILQSGSAFNPWTFTIRGDYKLAQRLGCQSTNDKEILDFLQKQNYKDICKMQKDAINYKEQYPGEIVAITPTIEPKTPNAFLSDYPEDLLEKGNVHQVPMMIGFTSNEGLTCMNPMVPQQLRPDFTDNTLLVPRDLAYTLKSKEELKKVGDQIKQFYYQDKTPSYKNMHICAQFFTDEMFAYNILDFGRRYTEITKQPVYTFECTFHTPLNLVRLFLELDYKGCCHADEISYLFKTNKSPETFNKESIEYKTIQRMTTLWTNFAKYGNPNSKDPLLNFNWEPFSRKNTTYLNIGNEVEVKANFKPKMVSFWDNLLKNVKKNSVFFTKVLNRSKL